MLISGKTSLNDTLDTENISLFNVKGNFYKNSFFPSTIIDWSKVDSNLLNWECFGIFKNNILKFFRPKPSSFVYFSNLKESTHITRLRLELNHLHYSRQHWYKSYPLTLV